MPPTGGASATPSGARVSGREGAREQRGGGRIGRDKSLLRGMEWREGGGVVECVRGFAEGGGRWGVSRSQASERS